MLFGMAETNRVLFAICAYFLHGCEKSRAVGHDHKRLDTTRHERKTSCALGLSAKHSARAGTKTRSHVLSCLYLLFAFGIGPCVLMAEGGAEYGNSRMLLVAVTTWGTL